MEIALVALVVANLALLFVVFTRQDQVRKETSEHLEKLRENTQKQLDDLRDGNQRQLDTLRENNRDSLEKMRETVDEKLQASVEKRFNESFKSIAGQLEQVHKGLGEMQTLAVGVGNLKKVMEGVKTRGVYGEVQLDAILKDILTKEQYEENVTTIPGTRDSVEFAVRMPGREDDANVWLPIDSKFPIENYSRLIEAYENGNKTAIEVAQKALGADVKAQAKKISEKYVQPPHTTDFGIMFVPTESLYAEILRIPGLFDEVRQKHRVTIVSPSTLTAFLNSLLLGFRTLAIEQRSSEVWELLGAVKTQFGKFGDLLAATKKKLEETANKIGAAETTSRTIERRLRDVETLPVKKSQNLIGEIED
ncbi:DNA recombination protein RmuC [Candidatus Saccharibacteria bacterium]|nr:DNA recombination protein RmuC [Candidatus Saccharibacteria bacterium]